MRRLPDEKEDLDGARFVNEDGKVPRVDEISVLRAFANNLRGTAGGEVWRRKRGSYWVARRDALVSRCWLGVEVIDRVSRAAGEATILVLPLSMAIS